MTAGVINKISDDLICLSAHNATLPKWFTPEIAAELDGITDFLFEASFVQLFWHFLLLR